MPIAMAIGAAMFPGAASAANSVIGNGGLELCPGGVGGIGSSMGVTSSGRVTCDGVNGSAGMAFSLNNAADSDGSSGFVDDTISARITGFADGRLVLVGGAGITMMDTVYMNGKSVTGLAPGAMTTSSKDAVNGAQLYQYTRYFQSNSPSSDPSTDAKTTGVNSVASGPSSRAIGSNSSAYGATATAIAPNSVALGQGSVASRNDSVSVGYLAADGISQYTRQITNVTAGAAGTDAVNVDQLNAAVASVSGGSGSAPAANAVTYDNSLSGLITLKGASGTKITNLTAGDISSRWSTDAVNGSQLYQTNQSVANVADSVADVSGNLTKVTNVVNNLVNNGIAGSPLVVQYDTSARDTVTLGGVGEANAVKLTRVAAGDISSASSTDAVNGSQLYWTNQKAIALADNLGSAIANIYNVGPKYFQANSTLANASSVGTDSVAIGGSSVAKASNSVALGSNSVADRANAVSVGAVGSERGIINVATGTADTDAVNVRQLNTAIANSAAGGSRDAVIYDTSAHISLTLGGVGATARVPLNNVAAGQVTLGGTDAVNGGQLYNTANSVAAALGAGTTVNKDGAITAPSFAVGGATYADVGGALQAINKAAGDMISTSKYMAVSPNVTAGTETSASDHLNAMAIGPTAAASGINALAVGGGAAAGNNGSTAVGSNAGALSINSTVVGTGATVASGSDNSVSIGYNARASAINSMALGTTALAKSTGSVAIGYNVFVAPDSTNSMALGTNASASHAGSVALGYNSSADRANAVSVGNTSAQRQIIHVAAGTKATDAVNVSQLSGVTAALGGGAAVSSTGAIQAPVYAVGGQTYTDVGSAIAAAADSGPANGVRYDTSAHKKVTLGGTSSSAPVTLTNVAKGVANSDAVNLAQLKAMGANVDSSGSVQGSFVAYDDSTLGTITLKGASRTTITNLAAGTLSAASKDAVNGSQLFETNENVANVAGNVTNVSNTVNNIVNGGGIKYFHANSMLADSSATGTNAVAIGGAASATAANSVALGSKSVANRANTVDVGSRQITDVANGTQAMDAVNLSQLQAMGANIDSSGGVTNAFVAYDDSTRSKITFGGTGSTTPVLLTNLAAGQVKATSRDAVNGSQLYSTASSVAAALGGGSGVGPNGEVTAPSYVIDNGKTFNDVGSALSDLDRQLAQMGNQNATNQKYIKVVSTASQAMASGTESVAIGGNSLATAAHALAIGAGATAAYANSTALGVNAVTDAANTLSVGSRGAEVRITNVANGINPTDAATVDQLNALQTQFSQRTSGVKSLLRRSSQLLGATPVTSYIAVSPNVVEGTTTQASNDLNAMAIGPVANASGENAMAIGGGTVAGSRGSTAVGSAAGALSVNATVIGAGATVAAVSDNSVAIGYNARGSAINSMALGTTAGATSTGSVAIGYHAFVYQAATNGMAFGTNASVTAAGGVAIGANAVADRANAVSVGSSTQQSQIINVAAGTQGTDAVNLTQMKAAIASAGGGSSGSPDAVVYDSSLHNKLTLGGTGTGAEPVALTNLAAGKITSSSTDAVNGAQLYNTASGVAEALGGSSSVGANGQVTKPVYTLNGNTYSDVGAALTAVNAVANNGPANGVAYDTTAHDKVTLGGVGSTAGPVTVSNVADGVANNDAVNVQQLKALGASVDSSGNVTAAFVAYDDATKGRVTFGDINSIPVVLANVAAGQVTSTSKQAINGSQLYGAMSSTATALGGGASVSDDGKVTTPTYTLSGSTYSDVGAALAALDAKSSSGSTDGVVYDTAAHDQLTLGGVGATTPVLLKNLAVGIEATDAVNVGQMESFVNTAISNGGGGTANGVAYDDSTKGQVTLGGVGSMTTPVKLTNVAAGTTANDAVNFAQLSALESTVNNLANGGAGNTTYVSIATPNTDGTAAAASGTDAIAIGNGASASGDSAIAIGAYTTSSGDHSTATGAGSSATGATSTAIGSNSSATGNNAVALGAGSVADRDNSVSVGFQGAERQITNVARGTQATDAVNLGQLNDAVGGLNSSINNVDRNAAKGIASASALNIVTPYLPGRTTLNAGVATYRGYQALGIGVSRWNEKGTLNYNLGVSSSGGNSTIVRAGIGLVLGN